MEDKYIPGESRKIVRMRVYYELLEMWLQAGWPQMDGAVVKSSAPADLKIITVIALDDKCEFIMESDTFESVPKNGAIPLIDPFTISLERRKCQINL